ncbi:putative phospholipid ABC transporter permease protein MlaE [Anaerohalosphaera lusitana]|uniref:Putative phospholipid ABC transporter permease protein MlaE n=1 Tax=Anaerohalosphaera lusitana TaxID=1936003 RepID=A0A1U9NLD3_9BACT|nr:ABC transporter permease [Anaerohalosphaera lusitana]AQT68635.1 putative phospholipid ABC transporter permease protein MlaE [Anaerohalosphaera lusitana]
MLEALGAATINWIQHLGRFARFLGRTTSTSAVSITQPKTWPLVTNQMYTIGVRSVPVVMITGAFVGMILAIQAYDQLAGMKLEERLGQLLNISVVKELGPVLAAVMLAGRVGGALTAELGTMNVTEQIAAVRSMGTDPVKYLVAPRVLACLLLTPFLIIYADLLGILGGYFVSVIQLKINSGAYWNYSAQGVQMWDIATGITKGFFFGAAISAISCYKGFHCRQGAQGVGQACTEAFVGSFIAILAINFVFAVIAKAIYNTFWPMPSLF